MSTADHSDESIGHQQLEDCPPSAKLVAKVLEYDGPLTQQELSEETLLPTRTVRYAVSQLDDIGVVQSRFSFTDARKRVYRLTDAHERV